jgi:hypothetical protein
MKEFDSSPRQERFMRMECEKKPTGRRYELAN